MASLTTLIESGSYQISISGSFTITRPNTIPLHTWTSSFNGDILRDDLNSGDWGRVSPYFTYLIPSSSNDEEDVLVSPFTQSVIDNWAYVLSGSGRNMSGSLHAE